MTVKRPPEPLTREEVRALLAACDGTALTGIRNRALLVMLWRAGLRCSEALDLRDCDVDLARGTVRVLHGKGDRARVVGIDDDALQVVRAWIGARDVAGVTSPWLFCTRDGGRVQARFVRAMTARVAARAGIAHRVHPHGLRHTLAVELAEEGWPVRLIQRQLGHTHLNTTAVYLDHLQPSEIIDRARVRSWAG